MISDKQLLEHYRAQQALLFKQNDSKELTLPAVSVVPFISRSHHKTTYKKDIIDLTETHKVAFIKEGKSVVGTVWKTSAKNLKQGVRWGIIRPESLTGEVISTLGAYRVVAHERILKGLISNSHEQKLFILDVYQSRFEVLQRLESMVNRENQKEDYQREIKTYIEQLEKISQTMTLPEGSDRASQVYRYELETIQADIKEDIKRANAYLNKVEKASSLRPFNRSRGNDSILSFVKCQMMENLYELQGVNQDLTYRFAKHQALTRGHLNDCIEDAFRVIRDYSADPRNQVLPQHHVDYGEAELVTYDFSRLSPEQSRRALLAVSFIEGCDRVDSDKVSSGQKTDSLRVIRATNWIISRNFKAFFKKIAYAAWNMLKSFFVETQPWEETAWKDPSFHLKAEELRAASKKQEPLWYKPWRFIRVLGRSFMDILYGLREIGADLAFRLPMSFIHDWRSTGEKKGFYDVKKTAEGQIARIKQDEETRLRKLVSDCECPESKEARVPIYANVPYHLTSGEHDDILTAIMRGLDEFTSVFTHNIFARDPVGGLAFTTGYAAGGLVILAPQVATKLFGAAYVKWFTDFSYAMGSSPISAAIAGGSTQGQLSVTALDTIVHGPNGQVAHATNAIMRDPVTLAAYFGAAYGLGYLLANGIAGYPIPGISDHLRDDLGKNPDLGYPIIGAKVAIALHAALAESLPDHFRGPIPKVDETELSEKDRVLVEQFKLISWLAMHHTYLPQLDANTLHDVEREIYEKFPKDHARSLSKLLYPERSHSISKQILMVPLGYVPKILRLLVSPVISLVALCKGRQYWTTPVKRAAEDLWRTIQKDLTRLVIFGSKLLQILIDCVSCIFEALAYTINFIFSRITALFGAHPSHAIHRGFATINLAARKAGEAMYPARAMKHVETAHPGSITSSYYDGSALKLAALGGKTGEEAVVIPKESISSSSCKNQTNLNDEQNASFRA